MPTYTYRCTHCQLEGDAFRSIASRNDGPSCPADGAPMERIIGQVNFARSTVKTDWHHSPITGKLTRNHKDVERQLKEINDETGSSLVLSDPTDPAAHGVTDEGLEETRRAKYDKDRDGKLWL